ncbi:MAG: ERAP1-like C-terminal domain-containing protein [Deltaproteobacteria bacterium]|nr:ERAP1-like C-terminal domain-containing protein [Deltaproteobacteria bacterium]
MLALRSTLWLFTASLVSCATAKPPEPGAPAASPSAASTATSAAPVTPPPAPALPPEPIPMLELPGDVRPTRYALELTISPDLPEFSGKADLSITLDRARDVIWLHGLDLSIVESTVQAAGETLPARYEQVNDDGVVKLTLPKPIGPGTAVLHFAWHRKFDPRLVGLYLAPENNRSYAFTQFEDIFARRAFPGFDQPGFKTPFDVTLVVPEGQVAVANTPPLGPAEKQPNGMKRIRYAPTKPLPTYLLAWAVGPFDVVDGPTLPPNQARANPVPLRAIVPQGRGADAKFALKASAELLLLEEAYFGIAYPYPQLDIVAVPDYAYGAMENAGEIHYREDLLLFKEGTTSEENRTSIASVIAHEEAHQWFGDLVTMRWWDEAWLNESFATWMAARMQEEWQPSMHAMIDLHNAVSAAMGNDALATARAIRQPVLSVKAIGDQFDALTYSKGGGVLAMFERFVGPEPFRRGVSDYIAAHAFGSGSTDDLLASFSKAAGREVAPAFHSFLDRAGVPLVKAKVTCAGKVGTLSLEQSRYFPLGSDGKQDGLWQLPVCSRYALAGDQELHETCTLLTKAQDTVDLPGCPVWLMPNADGAGYYRWSLDQEGLKKLRTAGYARLSVTERISLAQALNASVYAGTLPIADALAALAPIAADPEGEVARTAIGLITFARDRVLPEGDQQRADAYASKLFGPVMKRLGYKAHKGESTSDRRLRARVLGLLIDAGDKQVLAQAVKLGNAYANLGKSDFDQAAVDPDLAELVLRAAVEKGGAEIVDALFARLEKTEDADARSRILTGLTGVRDAPRVKRVLELTLSGKLRKQETIVPMLGFAGDRRTRDAAWSYLREHLDAVAANSPETYVPYCPSLVVAAYCDDAHARELTAAFEPVEGKYNGLAKTVRQARESIQLCVAQASAQRESALAFFSKGR